MKESKLLFGFSTHQQLVRKRFRSKHIFQSLMLLFSIYKQKKY